MQSETNKICLYTKFTVNTDENKSKLVSKSILKLFINKFSLSIRSAVISFTKNVLKSLLLLLLICLNTYLWNTSHMNVTTQQYTMTKNNFAQQSLCTHEVFEHLNII